MDKSGVVYRHIAEELLENRKARFVEREMARQLGMSPDTVSRAVKPLKRIGTATVYRTYFEVHNLSKLLLFWAVNRKLDRDIIYRTYVQTKDVKEIEDRMPGEVAYTEFSAYTKLFGNDVASYSEVYAYATEHARIEIGRRFKAPEMHNGRYNLILLKPDKVLEGKIMKDELWHSSVSIPQIYVDLWNNNTWYAAEFLKKLEKRIGDKYAKAVLEQ